jgi:hypothetical protein
MAEWFKAAVLSAQAGSRSQHRQRRWPGGRRADARSQTAVVAREARREQTNEYGEMAEWFKAAVLKTAVGLRPPWVRIPLSPPDTKRAPKGAFFVSGGESGAAGPSGLTNSTGRHATDLSIEVTCCALRNRFDRCRQAPGYCLDHRQEVPEVPAFFAGNGMKMQACSAPVRDLCTATDKRQLDSLAYFMGTYDEEDVHP